MSDTIIVGLLSLAGTALGAFGGFRLIAYRVEQLEKKVEAHNRVIERTYKLEGRVTEAEHDIRDLKARAS